MWISKRGRYLWTARLVQWGLGPGLFFITPEGIRLDHSFRLGFKASDNEAKYEALLAKLRIDLDMGAWEVEIYSNSRLVVS